MSAFRSRISAICVSEMERTVGLSARMAVTGDVAAALAASIAAQVDGVSTAAAITLDLVMDDLPALVAEQAALIRQARDRRPL